MFQKWQKTCKRFYSSDSVTPQTNFKFTTLLCGCFCHVLLVTQNSRARGRGGSWIGGTKFVSFFFCQNYTFSTHSIIQNSKKYTIFVFLCFFSLLKFIENLKNFYQNQKISIFSHVFIIFHRLGIMEILQSKRNIFNKT